MYYFIVSASVEFGEATEEAGNDNLGSCTQLFWICFEVTKNLIYSYIYIRCTVYIYLNIFLYLFPDKSAHSLWKQECVMFKKRLFSMMSTDILMSCNHNKVMTAYQSTLRVSAIT